MHEVVNLNFWTQLILTLFFLSLGLLYLVKRTAARPDLMVPECAVCGKLSTKKCSRCKSVRYCSARCQTSDWNSGHKLKCKASLFGNGSKIALLPHTKPTLTPTQVLFPYHQFVQYFHWDRPTLPPCGLINCGNSCFANVVLQCLSWTRPLVAYLLETGHKRECRRNDWCFLCEFQTHLQRANQTRIPFSPINIISRLPNIGGNLGYGRQEDAHELMRFAIDMMQSVCLEEFGGEKVVPPRAQQTTLIQHVFGGLLQSQVQCTVCSTVSGQYENMMDLTVEIHGDAMSLEECLNQFTAKEWLQGDNMYKCDRCNDYVKACKRLSIHRAPNILTIALKRFQSGRFGKLNKRITFPETFELGPYMTTGGEASDVYKLYAVIVHLDMLNASFFGHYICYVKDFCGNWYRIDDSEVENVELEDVLSQRAYMLLYSRVQTRPSSLRCDEIKEEKKTDKLSTEPSQDGLVECSWVGTNDTSVSPLCDGIIAHSERSECKKELSSSSAVSLIVSEKGKEVDKRIDTVDLESNPSIDMKHDPGTDLQAEAANGKADTVLDSESNPSIDMDHYSGTDGQEKAADGKEVPKIEYMAVDSSCWDITTSSPFDATECKAPQKEDSDTTMIDAQ